MPISKKNERNSVVNDMLKKRRRREEMIIKSVPTSLNYRDIKDWYYGDKFKSIRNFNYTQEMSKYDSLKNTNKKKMRDWEEMKLEDRKERDMENTKASINCVFPNKENLVLSKLKTNNTVDLFRNPGVPEKLVLKKTSKNIRLGYKKIIRQDTLYNELYQDLNQDGNFLCCKEYKKYVDYLFITHDEQDCGDVHKGRLEYLCEVACNELYNKSTKEFVCPIKSTCPLKFCKDTFCSQCNLCVTSSDTKNCFSSEKQSK